MKQKTIFKVKKIKKSGQIHTKSVENSIKNVTK